MTTPTDDLSHQYLHDHGDVVGWLTNQLICFDPSTHTWTNPKCFGTIPTPRYSHKTTIINDSVYLVGGEDELHTLDDFFELDMLSKTWTEIHSSQASPQVSLFASLTAISDRQLLYMGINQVMIRIYWICHPIHGNTKASIVDHPRCRHTASLGVNKSVIMAGGQRNHRIQYKPTFHIMLKAKTYSSSP